MSSGTQPATDTPQHSAAAWRQIVSRYQRPSNGRAAWQIANTFGSYALLWALLYWSLSVSWWLTVPLAVLAGALLVRIFIIFHDCGHGSYLSSPRANNVVGFISGVLTVTPFQHWSWQHGIHHTTAGHLDKRGTGDIWTMTVQEYLESSRWKRFAYRLARNPIILFVVAPLFVFLVMQRYPSPRAGVRERHSVWWTNLAMLCGAIAMSALFGFWAYLAIQLTVLAVAGAIGVWLFYVQHQFEETEWAREPDWEFQHAALYGSSYYDLPALLSWFTGNIGIHHVHHLSAKVPHYRLPEVLRDHPELKTIGRITLMDSFRSVKLALWDETRGKLVSFREARVAG